MRAFLLCCADPEPLNPHATAHSNDVHTELQELPAAEREEALRSCGLGDAAVEEVATFLATLPTVYCRAECEVGRAVGGRGLQPGCQQHIGAGARPKLWSGRRLQAFIRHCDARDNIAVKRKNTVATAHDLGP